MITINSITYLKNNAIKKVTFSYFLFINALTPNIPPNNTIKLAKGFIFSFLSLVVFVGLLLEFVLIILVFSCLV